MACVPNQQVLQLSIESAVRPSGGPVPMGPRPSSLSARAREKAPPPNCHKVPYCPSCSRVCRSPGSEGRCKRNCLSKRKLQYDLRILFKVLGFLFLLEHTVFTLNGNDTEAMEGDWRTLKKFAG